jgi:hypothetical protein
MGNAFRRIALAQGLLPRDEPFARPTVWTDADLAALLQVADDPAFLPPSPDREPPAHHAVGA